MRPRRRPQLGRLRLHRRDAPAQRHARGRPVLKDGGPDYAAVLPCRLARRLNSFLEAATVEIDALMLEDSGRKGKP